MLKPLRLTPLKGVNPAHHVAAIAEPLISAAEHGEDVSPIVWSIARSFGFDGFLYVASLSLQPVPAARQFVYSTWPAEVFRVYDERGYINVDPRVRDLQQSVTPLVWDQATYRGQSDEIDAFLSWQQSCGVASGITCPLRDVRGRLSVLFLSSGISYMDIARRLMIERNMGDIIQFGSSFHELFVNGALNQLMGPSVAPGNFTRRERECLRMASEGLTGEDIALKLGVSLRTVQGYFDRVRKKLGVNNRPEAVARGLQVGII